MEWATLALGFATIGLLVATILTLTRTSALRELLLLHDARLRLEITSKSGELVDIIDIDTIDKIDTAVLEHALQQVQRAKQEANVT